MLVLLILLGVSAFAQTTITAPWLIVYDQEGRPRWEIRMEKLTRTKDGWEGEGVSVTLFFAGAPTIRVSAPRLSADPLGRRWSLLGGLTGEGQGFSFSAEEARWEDRLILRGFSTTGHELAIFAKEARWELAGTLEFFSAEVQGFGWELSFPYGKYWEKLLVAQDVEGCGHGVLVRADFLEFQTEDGRAKFQRVKVVRNP